MSTVTHTEPLSQTSSVNAALWLRRYTKFLCALVLFLIFMGANVTSHNAGLAVPDWPTTYGYNMFTFPSSMWIGGVFHEHVHRLIASLVGFLTVVLTVWIWRVEKRKWVINLSLIMLLAVILQGVLGGLTVRYLLPAWISAFHGVLGQTFFCLTIAMAYSQSLEFNSVRSKNNKELYRWGIRLIVLLYLQLIIAVFVRHTESGLAILDFPTTAGNWIPRLNQTTLDAINSARRTLTLEPVAIYQIVLQLIHRLMGMVLLLAALILGFKVFCKNHQKTLGTNVAKFIALIIPVQFVLGVSIVVTQRAPVPTSLHVMTGALTLGCAVFLALREYRSNNP